ncbi:MAG: BlaI/MecI/CopY family transcriptional regulator [Lachnospiraceae bacterium]|nr:BlaI/MecI/CopY family transcriptional regulator [Lachnospiraceae bacterium]
MKKLSEAEFEIIQVLWRHKAPMTSNQILDEIKDGRQWKLASLMTTLARMADKGAVYCDRTTRTNYYSALVSEDEYKVTEGTSLLEKMFNKSAKDFIASLYQGKQMSGEDIQELRAYLDSLEKKGE